MSFSIGYFKCARCGEVNTISDNNKVEEQEEIWSLLSTPTTRRKFKQFAAGMSLKAGEALSYLLSVYEDKDSYMKEDNRFGTPNTISK